MPAVKSRWPADAVLLLHFAFVLFGVFGALLVLLDRRWMWIHIPAVLWSSIVNLASWTCPLTPVEQDLRRQAGESYEGGFIQHYVGSLVYPGGMPRRMELIAGWSILIWNVLLYGALFAWGAFR
jgi:uncharacterized protein DUF2784